MNGRFRKQGHFSMPKLQNIDYKDTETLKKFTTEAGKLVPSRITGTSARMQRRITKSVKIARFLALMPFCDNHK